MTVQIAATNRWISLNEFSKLVHAINSTDISVQVKRTNLLDQIQNVSTTQDLFGETIRFPRSAFANLDERPWMPLLLRLCSTLTSLRDREAEVSRRDHIPQNGSATVRTDSKIDAQQQFWTTVRDLNTAFQQPDNFYTRDSFEERFHLTWN